MGRKTKTDAWYDRVNAAELELRKRFKNRMKKVARERDFTTRNESGKLMLVVNHTISPSSFSSRLNFRDFGDLLEREWPGCSVMWDAHPELKHWHTYCLMIVTNYMTRPPYKGRYVDDIGHRKYRTQVEHTITEASVEGDFMLVAYQLHMPGKKPVQIAVEGAERRPRTTRMVENGVRAITVTTPVRAVFTASAIPPRWTLVR